MPFLRRHVYKAYALTKEIAVHQFASCVELNGSLEQVAVLLRSNGDLDYTRAALHIGQFENVSLNSSILGLRQGDSLHQSHPCYKSEKVRYCCADGTCNNALLAEGCLICICVELNEPSKAIALLTSWLHIGQFEKVSPTRAP